jgi:polysaccharide biosynthesis/export protein
MLDNIQSNFLFRLLFIVLIVGGCSHLSPLPPPTLTSSVPASAFQQFKAAYVIGPEDILNIVVYGHTDLSTQVAVADDGAFSYPLLDRVKASGLTTQELETQMTKVLAEFVVNPQVSVTVIQFLSQQVYVIGEIRAPGPQNLKHASTLLEILAKAGGPTSEAGWEVVILRSSNTPGGISSSTDANTESNMAIHVDLERLMVGELPRPIQVLSGDTIYIPRATFYYISGEINRPGRYRLERDTTIAKALTVAGGPTRFAAKSRMTVQRIVGGERKEFHVEPNNILQSDDVLTIPQSVF